MRMRNSWLVGQLRRFAGCRDGAAALEFALVLPPLSLILVGMFEVSMLMFTQASMEGALREAARFGMTGAVEDPVDREAQIRDVIETYTFSMIDMNEMTVTFEVYDSFGDANGAEPYVDSNLNGQYDVPEPYTNLNGGDPPQWDDGIGQAGVGASAEVVRYDVQYDWHTMTPFMAAFIGDNGTVHLGASVVIRNEPWEAIGES